MATRVDGWLTTTVLAHLGLSFLHGFAHNGGQVGLTPAQSLFVFTVILAGPVIGLILSLFSPRLGGLLVAATMTGAFVFGVVNHFIIISADHVTQVAADWRQLFTASAILLVVSEAAGSIAGLRSAFRGREAMS